MPEYPEPGTKEAEVLFIQLRDEALEHPNYFFPIYSGSNLPLELKNLVRTWQIEGRLTSREGGPHRRCIDVLAENYRAWPDGEIHDMDEELANVLAILRSTTNCKGPLSLLKQGLTGKKRQYVWQLYRLGILGRNSQKNFYWK